MFLTVLVILQYLKKMANNNFSKFCIAKCELCLNYFLWYCMFTFLNTKTCKLLKSDLFQLQNLIPWLRNDQWIFIWKSPDNGRLVIVLIECTGIENGCSGGDVVSTGDGLEASRQPTVTPEVISRARAQDHRDQDQGHDHASSAARGHLKWKLYHYL